MKKITYLDKTNDESAPSKQQSFFATDANEIKQVVNNNATEEIAFNDVVVLNKNYVSEYLINGPIHYTFNVSQKPTLGSIRKDYITADGINKPTFDDNFKFRYDGYLNEQNKVHRISMEYVGSGQVLVDITYV